MKTKLLLLLLSVISQSVLAQQLGDVSKHIETNLPDYNQIALQIWNYAEMGYQEHKSSKLLKDKLVE